MVRYEAIVPRKWHERREGGPPRTFEDTVARVEAIMDVRRASCRRTGESLNGIEVTFNGVTTILEIMDNKLLWWFRLKDNHDPPTEELYDTAYPDTFERFQEPISKEVVTRMLARAFGIL